MQERFTTGRVELEWSQFGMEHRVAVDGQIDERAELVEFSERLTDTVVIDLANVSFVNSLGLREWIRMLYELQERHVEVTLSRCSESMVHQMCMVVAAKGDSKIESFFAPYECDACGHVASVCLEVEENLAAFRRLEVPDEPCPECGQGMEFNEIPERYLLFLELE